MCVCVCVCVCVWVCVCVSVCVSVCVCVCVVCVCTVRVFVAFTVLQRNKTKPCYNTFTLFEGHEGTLCFLGKFRTFVTLRVNTKTFGERSFYSAGSTVKNGLL